MKNSYLLIGIFLLTLISCKEKHDYLTEIEGKWICNEVNSLIVPSSQAFVLSFNASMKMEKQAGFTFLEDSALWVTTHYSYHIEKDEIVFSGINETGKTINDRYKILVLTGSKLWLESSNQNKYTLFRSTKGLQTQLIGEWEGAYSDSLSIELFCSDNGVLELKENGIITIKGNYFLNGNLLTVNYSEGGNNDFNHYQNWTIDIQDSQLKMVQYLPIPSTTDLQIKIYNLKRKDSTTK